MGASTLWAERGHLTFSPTQALVRLRVPTLDWLVPEPQCVIRRDILARGNVSRAERRVPSSLGPASPKPNASASPLPALSWAVYLQTARSWPTAPRSRCPNAELGLLSGWLPTPRSLLPALLTGAGRGFWDTQRGTPGNFGAPR